MAAVGDTVITQVRWTTHRGSKIGDCIDGCFPEGGSFEGNGFFVEDVGFMEDVGDC